MIGSVSIDTLFILHRVKGMVNRNEQSQYAVERACFG